MANQIPIEEWRVVEGFPAYAVSNLGRVKRILPIKGGKRIGGCGHLLKTSKWQFGYRSVMLYRDREHKTLLVHQLVCRAFRGPRPTRNHEVGHCDGNPSNNCADNLRWVTGKENAEDRDRHNRTARGERHYRSSLTEEHVREIRRLLSQGYGLRKIGRMFGVNHWAIHAIRERQNWSWLD